MSKLPRVGISAPALSRIAKVNSSGTPPASMLVVKSTLNEIAEPGVKVCVNSLKNWLSVRLMLLFRSPATDPFVAAVPVPPRHRRRRNSSA